MWGNNGGAPTGPMLLLKSLGFDPQAIMANVESAKTTANEVMQHFDKRLQALERQGDAILLILHGLLEDAANKTKVQ